jgi:hypothetical protein
MFWGDDSCGGLQQGGIVLRLKYCFDTVDNENAVL